MVTLSQYNAERLLSDDAFFREMYHEMPMARQKKIDRIKVPEVRGVSLAAGILVNNMCEAWHIDSRDLITSEYGKLMVPGGRPPYFSISHKHKLAVLAVSKDHQVGVDIEYIGLYRGAIVKRFYTVAEQAALDEIQDERKKREEFYRMWTMKEAYGKLVGDGLATGLNFDSTRDHGSIKFTHQFIETDYIVTICEKF
ncbi:MAG: 4'-phosphopantetheinyl transferase superfamily protein [Lachnospiraceae bacterium]|nr:4'-phosphopantetheinyl transferase superfamily protein [Lachnospiraceae bacterium]